MAKCDFNYNKLRGKIRETVGTEKELSRIIGRSQNYLTNVFKGKSVFTPYDIVEICVACNIDDADLHIYFFDRKVAKTAHVEE